LDLDDVPLAEGTDRKDLGACYRAAVALLPSEFRGVRTWVQATGGHGLKPGAR
jgi:hypothetical protein